MNALDKKAHVDLADALGWDFLYGAKEPRIGTRGDGFHFKWGDEGQIDYLMKPFHGDLDSKIKLTFEMKTVKGHPKFKATEGDAPATFGVMIQRDGDKLYGDQAHGNMRFWSRDRIEFKDVLDKGKQTIVLDLRDLDEWSNVWGKTARQEKAGWHNTLDDIGNIGLTYGGQFYGHGVKVKHGEVKVIVEDFIV